MGDTHRVPAQPRPRRARVPLAVAVVVIAAGAAVVMAGHRDDGANVRSVGDAVSTTESTTTITTTTTTSVPAKTDRPATIAAVVDPDGDGSGSVVVLDASDGRVLRTLVPDGAADVDVAPDGTIYYQTYAPEFSDSKASIVAIDPADGAKGTTYPSSWRPAISPDGTRLARGQADPFTAVATSALPTGKAEDVMGIDSPDRSGDSHDLGDLAWSRDGERLAVEIVDHHYYPVPAKPVPRVALVRSRQGSVGAYEETAIDVPGAASPVFAADGRLLVIAGATGPDRGNPISGDRIVVWDPHTKEMTGEGPLPHVSRLDASADGRWVIATRVGLPPVIVTSQGAIGEPEELPDAPSGVIAAAW